MSSGQRDSYMAFCPLDYRYGCKDFKEIWSELGRHQRQLEVERALVWAHKEMGKVSEEDYAKVAEIAVPSVVTKERVSEIEAETRHEANKGNRRQATEHGNTKRNGTRQHETKAGAPTASGKRGGKEGEKGGGGVG